VATLLVWVTHALLDAMTVYGTRLWLPFSSQAVGVGSVFIIDPLYTLPLLAGLLGMWALRGKAAQRSLWLGLTISSLYLAWSVLAQQWVKHQVQPHLPNPQVKVLVTPSAFNTLLWRVVAVDNQAYHETWVSLFDDEQPPQWQRVTCPVAAFEPYQQVRVVAQLANFSDGFFCFRASGKRWQITDLRMGQEPNYVFTFQGEPVGGDAGNGWRVTQLPFMAPPIGDALRWLGQRTLGHTQLPFEQWQAAGKTRP
jgi:inner membrane protein